MQNNSIMQGNNNSVQPTEAEKQTLAFVKTITGDSHSPVCARTFDDDKDRKDGKLAKKRNGPIKPSFAELQQLNAQGAGVFMVINEGGQTDTEITKVRAVFADTDGAPHEPLLCLKPHLVVKSSPGKWHVYWLTDDDFPLDMFKPIQLAIATKYGTDKSVHNLSRVMRVSGFNHCKDEPFPVRITKQPKGLAPYSLQQIIEGLGLDVEAKVAPDTPEWVRDNAGGLLDEMASDFPDSVAERVAERCKQVANFRDTGCPDSEPVWRACLGVVKHCKDGEKFAHEWSAKDSRYNHDEAQQKIDRWTTGPTKCATFKEINPSLCAECPHTCTSPIQLGVEAGEQTGESDPVIARYNESYFVAPCGGTVYVYREQEGAAPVAMSKTAFFDLHANDIIGTGKDAKNAASHWFRHRGRRQYMDGVVFDPTCRSSEDAYNLFTGYAIQPKPGNCDLVLDHVENVLCAGDAAMNAFVLDWVALMFQTPKTRPDTALVFQSGEGTGKGLFATILTRMMGRQYVYKAPSMNALVTQYNDFLQRCILVIGEEAVWSGDAGKAGILKDLITAPELRIEVKLGPVYSVPSYLHGLFFTNEQWAVPAGNDARRWAVNRASDHRKGDTAYFSRLAKWADDPDSLAAFMHFLMALSELAVAKSYIESMMDRERCQSCAKRPFRSMCSGWRC